MLKTLILVSERMEEQQVLGERLLRQNAALTIERVLHREEIERFSPQELRQARVIGFCTDIVVPARVLRRLGFGAYNFHPGAPAYPGWGAASFAVYDRATRFGTTAHVMEAKVDAGAIVGTSLFDVPPGADQTRLEELTFRAAIDLFAHLANPLANRFDPLPTMDIAWGARRCTRKAYAEMCQIPPDMPVDELTRRLRAFGAGPFGLRRATPGRDSSCC